MNIFSNKKNTTVDKPNRKLVERGGIYTLSHTHDSSHSKYWLGIDTAILSHGVKLVLFAQIFYPIELTVIP